MSVSEQERRQAYREAVCRSARITYGDAAVDCLVMDVSARGARVRTAVAVSLPEHVTLRFHNGSIFDARRCWVRGAQVGFEFAGAPVLSDEAVQQAQAVHDMLRTHGTREAIRLLRTLRFFDDLALREVVQEVEAAQARFEAALRQRAQADAVPRAALT